MPPPDRRPYDERDDYDDMPRRRRSVGPGLVVSLALGGLLLTLVVCAGIGMVGFRAAPAARGRPGPAHGGG